MLKRTKMFAGVVRIKRARQELKHETELLSKNVGFSDFPPTLWAHAPDYAFYHGVRIYQRSSSYRGYLNAEFNAPHPDIYVAYLSRFCYVNKLQHYVTVS